MSKASLNRAGIMDMVRGAGLFQIVSSHVICVVIGRAHNQRNQKPADGRINIQKTRHKYQQAFGFISFVQCLIPTFGVHLCTVKRKQGSIPERCDYARQFTACDRFSTKSPDAFSVITLLKNEYSAKRDKQLNKISRLLPLYET